MAGSDAVPSSAELARRPRPRGRAARRRAATAAARRRRRTRLWSPPSTFASTARCPPCCRASRPSRAAAGTAPRARRSTARLLPEGHLPARTPRRPRTPPAAARPAGSLLRGAGGVGGESAGRPVLRQATLTEREGQGAAVCGGDERGALDGKQRGDATHLRVPPYAAQPDAAEDALAVAVVEARPAHYAAAAASADAPVRSGQGGGRWCRRRASGASASHNVVCGSTRRRAYRRVTRRMEKGRVARARDESHRASRSSSSLQIGEVASAAGRGVTATPALRALSTWRRSPRIALPDRATGTGTSWSTPYPTIRNPRSATTATVCCEAFQKPTWWPRAEVRNSSISAARSSSAQRGS